MIAATADPANLAGQDREMWDAFTYTQTYAMATEWSAFIDLYKRGRLGAAVQPGSSGPTSSA